ncbi:TetR/AcrR family transcriptional regulator [Streptomyces sp. NPDC058611]|uniref:TetR/AcrR family transcriptional regulator n=1 Tax=unclassified Streptomyces TaxID=2593676 RepID=UPI003661A9FC
MPLPRFERLPADRQEHFLAVARRHFADYGAEAASYNKIIEATGFSKTAAYQYFDGRDDLLGAVLDGVRERLLGALGPWRPAGRAEEFWARLDQGSKALVTHLYAHADDLALADASLAHAGDGQWIGWFGAVVDNGRQLGVVRPDIDRELLVAATAAVFRAADAWALAALRETEAGGSAPAADGGGDGEEQVWSLLRGLWTAPGGTAPGGGGGSASGEGGGRAG